MQGRFISEVRRKSYGVEREGLRFPYRMPGIKGMNRLMEVYDPQMDIIYGTVNKPTGKNVITGPCFLASTDISRMKSVEETDPAAAKKIFIECMRKAPTFQNVVCQGYPLEGNVAMVLETYEYANFLETDDEIMEETMAAAERTIRICRKYQEMLGSNAEVQYVWTQEEGTREMIDDIWMSALSKCRVSKDDMRKKIKMRIEATYMPEFAEQIFGDSEYTVAENYMHGIECASGDVFSEKFRREFESGQINFLGLLPPRSIDKGEGKMEMDNGQPLYLGEPETLSQQLQEMRANSNGSFFTSPAGNLLLFTGNSSLSEAFYGLTESKNYVKRVDPVWKRVKEAMAELQDSMFNELEDKLMAMTGEA